MKQSINVMWFRRDLRLEDNAALYYALKAGKPVLPIFIFDKNILSKLSNKADRRVNFIAQAIASLEKKLNEIGSSLKVYFDTPENSFAELLSHYTIENVFTNHDYEPYAKKRDEAIATLLQKSNATLKTYKDQVIFEKGEILKDDGTAYTVFTPYSKKWKLKLNDFYLSSYPVEKYNNVFHKTPPFVHPLLSDMDFESIDYQYPIAEISNNLLQTYGALRDFPGIDGTSKLGVHLRFGTISIRQIARKALEQSEVYLNELIWRDFYQMILWNFLKVGEGAAFRAAYDDIKWRNNEQEFLAWCSGKTGYPIVDAGMRELNATGYMHNRVRMITASFLTKHLLIDWRWGEAYFAEKLLDFDLAANNGGWQWAAGSGCDAAPYFRVFNPTLQTEKFDKELKYIRKWVPELDGFEYPAPIVAHNFARERALKTYKIALDKSE